LLAICILSVFYFALAAPVPVGEALEVRSNAVGALKDEKVVWEKRMSSNGEGQNAGNRDPWWYESDARSPDTWYNDDPYDSPNTGLDSDTNYDSDSGSDDDDGGGGDDSSGDGDGGNGNDSSDDDSDNDDDDDDAGAEAEADEDDSGNGNSGYDGDEDGEMAETDMVEKGMAETDSPELMTYIENVLGPLMHRPRNSGSGAVSSQRGVAGWKPLTLGRTSLTLLSLFK
jgi:hypothetical protein